ncbi:MAG TPA: carboxypeptidase-like regulatory domain-containing protein [Dinghuibacter sp.]|uniref:TonB-dependent receptor n=1 Tax=Dinghuibacter sp. TaxID=2024697 RepID=UPI002C1AF182|nr:carboxypeptidase-like regulatory domain-containing protein [Dinghuibacter sp.]HTJ13492.1 carboxypeptidase-like regulatory domain-containing protein [Dinghuibacter sp.]
MRLVLTFSVLMGLCLQGMGQVRISGQVVNKKKKPVPGASIAVKDSYDGATSDSTGHFSFTTTEKGRVLLEVTAVSYKDYDAYITLTGAPVQQDIVLADNVSELGAVVITAGSFAAGDKQRGTVLSSLDIYTTAGANADITSAIKTLPGAQQVGNQTGLFVRGGTAEETKVFIDGSLVNNYFYTGTQDIASRGRFSPSLFQGTVFSSGGYSALYGQALSSALILESTDLPDKTQGNLGISTVGLSGGYDYLAPNKRYSMGFDYSYVNLWPSFQIIKQTPDYFRVPVNQTIEGNFRVKTGKNGLLKFYAYYSGDRFGLRRPDIDSGNLKDAFSLQNGDFFGDLSWKQKFGKWRLTLSTSYSNNLDKIQATLQDAENQPVKIPAYPYDAKDLWAHNLAQLAQGKAILEYKLHGLSAIRVGGEYQYGYYQSQFYNDTIPHVTTGWTDNYTAAFAEADIYITPLLALKLGGRAEYSSLLAKTDVAPRLSAAYKVGPGQFSLAYGVFYQKPDNNYLLFGQDKDYQKATHYIANYQIMDLDHTFRLEGFYKKYNYLTKTFPDTAGNGFGYAKGIELFWRDKKTFKGIDYWVSYSYLDTKRDYLNFPYEMEPSFAARHTASVVVKKFVQKWKTGFNVSYSFATGRPYYNISDYAKDYYYIADQGRTIPYNNMSLSINYIPTLSKPNSRHFTVWVLSLNNILNIKEVDGYNYSYDNQIKQAIEPPAGRFLFVGCFISFGVDRTQDAINNNL